jgi:hypothetical protein
VRSQIPVQSRWRNHGGLTPPAPALLCECPPAKNDFCGGQTQVQPRAAGVSPPWLSEPNVVRSESRNVRRLAHAESRAATVSPPWVLRKCTCRNAAAKSRETAIGALTNPGAVAVAKPRGAYAPRSCVAVRMSAGEKRIFALHKRRFNQERRASARRGSVNRASCGQNRAMFGDCRIKSGDRQKTAIGALTNPGAVAVALWVWLGERCP